MIWIYVVFLFLFFNELGFIAYQTYLYNMMCMDLFFDVDFNEVIGDISNSITVSGTVLSLDTGISFVSYMIEPESSLVYDSFIGTNIPNVIYHLNFSSQLYPSTDELLFQVLQRHIYTSPGDLTLVFFHMENYSSNNFSGVTIYTISPFYLSYYVQKIQCFCFEELQIQSHQSLELPVIFYIDPLVENANWYSLTVEYIFLFT